MEARRAGSRTCGERNETRVLRSVVHKREKFSFSWGCLLLTHAQPAFDDSVGVHGPDVKGSLEESGCCQLAAQRKVQIARAMQTKNFFSLFSYSQLFYFFLTFPIAAQTKEPTV